MLLCNILLLVFIGVAVGQGQTIDERFVDGSALEEVFRWKQIEYDELKTVKSEL